jgi:hypothetical protein
VKPKRGPSYRDDRPHILCVYVSKRVNGAKIVADCAVFIGESAEFKGVNGGVTDSRKDHKDFCPRITPIDAKRILGRAGRK